MAAECLEKILAAQGLDRAPDQKVGDTPSGILFVCSAFLCPSASRASSRQNRFGDCAESSGQSGFQPPAGKLSKHFVAATSPSLAESIASPFQNTVSPRNGCFEQRSRFTDQQNHAPSGQPDGGSSAGVSSPSMSIGILGKKLGMSQFFDEQGKAVPVTLIEAGPCRITQLKNSDTDGYAAVQIGFGETREKLINKPSKGHLNKTGESLLRHLREYRVDGIDGFELGGSVTVGDFEAGQKVDVSGDTIGRGFAGYQKRHGFSRGPMTHGSKNHRQPGSIGPGTTPGRIYPGKRMAGRYGGKKITTRGLTILKVDNERNLLVVKGSVPGKPGALLNIRPAVRVGDKTAKGGK